MITKIDKNAVRLMFSASNASTQLVQSGQSETR